MFSNFLWGIILITVIALMYILDKRKQRRNLREPYREKNAHEKEIEKQIAIEKERSRRGGPPGGRFGF